MRITVDFWRKKQKGVKDKDKHNCSQTKKWGHYYSETHLLFQPERKITDTNLFHSLFPISVDFVSCFCD